ncbi:hypothetical protein EJB05_51783, partial [Eragrostis curvula]
MRHQATHRHPGDPAPAALPRSPALLGPRSPASPPYPASSASPAPRRPGGRQASGTRRPTGTPATRPLVPSRALSPTFPLCCLVRLIINRSFVDLLLGKAYSDWGHINDAVSVYDQLISEHPEDFHPYLAKGSHQKHLQKLLLKNCHVALKHDERLRQQWRRGDCQRAQTALGKSTKGPDECGDPDLAVAPPAQNAHRVSSDPKTYTYVDCRMHLPRGSEGPMEDEARQCQGDTVDHQYEDLVLLLPDDAITNVLRRLTPVDLAVSRCVRKAWCEIIDDRRLLLPRLIPHAVGGIFIKFNCLDSWEFLARPMAPPSMSCRIDFLPDHKHAMDHCNGLLLMEDYVLNPATGRSAPLPSRPQLPRMGTKYFYHDQYLIFDPTVSLHHEVLVIPRINYHSKEPYYGFNEELDPTIEESEWPPLSCNLLVFSSRTGQWEDRLFCRKGKPMGTVTDMRSASLLEEKRCTVYWQADVYVHCEADFVLRICLSRGKYEVIKPPIDITVSKDTIMKMTMKKKKKK